MYCTLSLTVVSAHLANRASFNSTTDSFSWGHDPCTRACKARPSMTDVGLLSECQCLFVIVTPVHPLHLEFGVGEIASAR